MKKLVLTKVAFDAVKNEAVLKESTIKAGHWSQETDGNIKFFYAGYELQVVREKLFKARAKVNALEEKRVLALSTLVSTTGGDNVKFMVAVDKLITVETTLDVAIQSARRAEIMHDKYNTWYLSTFSDKVKNNPIDLLASVITACLHPAADFEGGLVNSLYNTVIHSVEKGVDQNDRNTASLILAEFMSEHDKSIKRRVKLTMAQYRRITAAAFESLTWDKKGIGTKSDRAKNEIDRAKIAQEKKNAVCRAAFLEALRQFYGLDIKIEAKEQAQKITCKLDF